MADMSKYGKSSSRWMKARDYLGKRFKAIIEGIEEIHYEANERGPEKDIACLTFKGKELGIQLNVSNVKILCEAYGTDSNDWIGHEIGLSTMTYEEKNFPPGWIVKPLDIKEPDYEDLDVPAWDGPEEGRPDGLPDDF